MTCAYTRDTRRLDSLERCAPGLLTHKLLRTYLQQYSLRDLPEVVKLTMLLGVTTIRRELGGDGPVSINTLRKHLATGHAAAIVGRDISGIENHLRSMKEEIDVFHKELRSTGHDDGEAGLAGDGASEGCSKGATDENVADRVPLQNLNLRNEERGTSQVIRPPQTFDEGGSDEAQRSPMETKQKRVSFSHGEVDDKSKNGLAENVSSSAAGVRASSRRQQYVRRRTRDTDRESPSTGIYFKPSSTWRKGHDESDDAAGTNARRVSNTPDSQTEHGYSEYEVSKMIYPSWWFHPGGSKMPRRPVSAHGQQNQPRLAYKGPTREEERERELQELEKEALQDDLVTGAYVGVPSSGYGKYSVHEGNDTNVKNVRAMATDLRSTEAPGAGHGMATVKPAQSAPAKQRPRFNNYLKPVQSMTTESKVRQRLLQQHIEAQERHDARLRAIDKAFYPAKHEARKSVEAALNAISNKKSDGQDERQAAGVSSGLADGSSPSAIVDDFFSNPILSRFCDRMRDDHDVGAQVLGTAGFGADVVAGAQAPENRQRGGGSLPSEPPSALDRIGQILQEDQVAAGETLRTYVGDESDRSAVSQRKAAPPHPAPRAMQRREPWVGDFGHLEQFSRFPKNRTAQGQAGEVMTDQRGDDAVEKDNILFKLAEDSRESRQRVSLESNETLASTAPVAPPPLSPDVKNAMRSAGMESGMAPPLSPDVKNAMRAAGGEAGMAYTTMNPILAQSPEARRSSEEARSGEGATEERPSAVGTLHNWMSENFLSRQ